MILVICANPAIDTYIHFDVFSPGRSNRVIKEFKYPGGKGVHVALALRELEEKVTLLAFWGNGNGKWIKKKCREVGIKCIGPKIKDQNRICYSFKTNDGFNETEIFGRGPEINSRICDKFISEFTDILPKIEIISVSGSLPPGCPPDFYQNLLRIATEAGKPMFIDFIGEPFKLAVNEHCEGIHLNYNEFCEFFSAKNPEEAARVMSKKSRFAAVTRGKDGLFLASGGTLIHAHLHLDKIHSSVGSGDTLLAGLVAAHRRKYSLQEMARLGVACGAAKCVNDEMGLIHINDVIEFLPHVNIKSVEG
jgi:tagatose 6-phosphate kinase